MRPAWRRSSPANEPDAADGCGRSRQCGAGGSPAGARRRPRCRRSLRSQRACTGPCVRHLATRNSPQARWRRSTNIWLRPASTSIPAIAWYASTGICPNIFFSRRCGCCSKRVSPRYHSTSTVPSRRGSSSTPGKSLPANVVRPERNKRQHLSGVLARNEINRDYAYNRSLFLRVATGRYQFNPNARRASPPGRRREAGSRSITALNLPLIGEFAYNDGWTSTWDNIDRYRPWPDCPNAPPSRLSASSRGKRPRCGNLTNARQSDCCRGAPTQRPKPRKRLHHGEQRKPNDLKSNV